MTIYTTGCPKCRVLEKKLEQLGETYETVNDVQKVVEVGRREGILSAPILERDGKFYDFTHAVSLVNELARGN